MQNSRARLLRDKTPNLSLADVKARQSSKIREIGEALITEKTWGESSTWSSIGAGRCVLRSSTLGASWGVGNRKIAIDWNALHHFATAEDDHITLDLTRDQVKAAPEYKDGRPVVLIGTAESLPQSYPASE